MYNNAKFIPRLNMLWCARSRARWPHIRTAASTAGWNLLSNTSCNHGVESVPVTIVLAMLPLSLLDIFQAHTRRVFAHMNSIRLLTGPKVASKLLPLFPEADLDFLLEALRDVSSRKSRSASGNTNTPKILLLLPFSFPLLLAPVVLPFALRFGIILLFASVFLPFFLLFHQPSVHFTSRLLL